MSLTIQSGGSITLQGGSGGGGGGGATVGTYASRPAAGNAGALYICTDSPIAQWVDDGSAWRPLILGQALGTQVPAASAFTAFGSGFSHSDDNGTLSMSCTSGGLTLCGATVTHTSATAYVQGVVANTSGSRLYTLPGIIMRTADGAAVAMHVFGTSSGSSAYTSIGVSQWTNNSSRLFWGGVVAIGPNAPIFLRISKSAADGVASYSIDGRGWTTATTISDAFATQPTQVGVCFQRDSDSSGKLLHFKYGSL